MTLRTIKKNLESRMFGNLHVRFGVGGGVQLPALHHVTFIRDYLRSLPAETAIDIYMTVDNDPVLFAIGDGDYRYVVMPMIRDTTAVAKPEADTGIEVAGQESTMEEEPMKDIDEIPCTDDDTDLQTRFFQLQMENDQLQAKAEHYKTLLDRAMLVIERMKNDQRVCV